MMTAKLKSGVCRVLLAAALCSLSAGSFADEHYHHGWHRGFDHDHDFHRHWRHHDDDGFDGNFGLYFGSPLYNDPFYWDDDPYDSYPPPVYYAPPQPRVYIQRSQPQPRQQRQSAQYWYWCRKPSGYYPYIKQCPTPWQRVVPYGTPPA